MVVVGIQFYNYRYKNVRNPHFFITAISHTFQVSIEQPIFRDQFRHSFMINPKRIIKNSIFISSGLLIDGLILFLIFVLIARYLDVGLFGRFVFLVSLANIFQLFANGGIVNITVREIARKRENLQHIISASLTLSWIFLGFIYLLLYLALDFVLPEAELKTTVCLLAGAALIMVHAAIHAAVLRAHENMGRVALTALIHKSTLLAGVSTAIYLDSSMIGIALAYLFAAFINWCILYIWVRTCYVRTQWCFDLGYWLFLIKQAIPLGLGLMLRRMTTHADTLLLTLLATAIAVGLFNSAYRVTQMLEVAFLALSGVLFPVFSRLAKQSMLKFNQLYKHSLRFFIIFCTPLAIWLMLLSKEIILIAYGEAFQGSAHVLMVLSASLFFIMPGSLFFSVFSALNKQHLFLILTAFSLSINVGLDFWLIPLFSNLGAAFATLIAELLFFITGAILLYKRGVSAVYHVIYTRCLVACILPGILLHWSTKSGDYWIMGLASVLYISIYFLFVYLFKLIPKDEWHFFCQLVKNQKESRPCSS
ncbi:MAG: hypothetical protein DRR42_03715 [Gammaproteobacteria bacterium]|nr:MAG: hypothetical protein DRR42_03715 [Gammaproteobacteria bacterium]